MEPRQHGVSTDVRHNQIDTHQVLGLGVLVAPHIPSFGMRGSHAVRNTTVADMGGEIGIGREIRSDSGLIRYRVGSRASE